MSCLRGDEAALYERYAQRLQRAVARVLGPDRRHAKDGCAFLAQRERRESAPTPPRNDAEAELTWEECVEGPKSLEQALDGREAAELLTSLRRREGRYLALLAAGYSYREVSEREEVTYTNVSKHLARANRRAQALGKGAKHPAAAVRES